MGLFSSKESKEIKSTLDWLEKVENERTEAYIRHDARKLQNYFDTKVLANILEDIRMGGRVSVGLERYKHISWKQVEVLEDDTEVWLKKVSYDHVKIGYGLFAPTGNDYSERWCILISPHRKILDIRRE